MGEYETLTHTFEPVYNADSEILILGTFPSVKSRQQHFYYGHPQNRFWKVLAAVTGDVLPAASLVPVTAVSRMLYRMTLQGC